MTAHALPLIALAVLLPWSIYRRVRRNVGPQALSPLRLGLRLAVVVGILGAFAWGPVRAGDVAVLAALLAGGLAGTAVAAFALRHTRFERRDGSDWYVPNAIIGLTLSALLIARMGWRMVELWPLLTSPQGLPPGTFSHPSALTAALLGLVLAYYGTYYAGVLRHPSRRAAPAPSRLRDNARMHPIPARERLIAALDLPDIPEAKALVVRLGDTVDFYKIGLELFMAPGFFGFLDWLRAEGKKVFVDLKFFDIPETVARAVQALSARGADFCTVHGNQAIMEAAAKAKSGGLRVLAVTALTSLDRGDLDDLGFACDVPQLVLSRARRALAAGCDGVVSSGLEVEALKREVGGKLVCVTPGIRPVDNRQVADQKRVMTPSAAIRAGADYIVVGRPIRDAADPRATAAAIQREIAEALA